MLIKQILYLQLLLIDSLYYYIFFTLVHFMDLVNFQREMEQYQLHLERVKNIKPYIDTTTPKSLGLKHLASRPKKQQLINNRNQVIAQENKKLMEKMTKVWYLWSLLVLWMISLIYLVNFQIMASERPKVKYSSAPSLNETERRHQVDRVNSENRHLAERLKKTGAVIDTVKME